MHVYLHPSAEAVALGTPLERDQQIRWFVRWPKDLQEQYGDDLSDQLGIDAATMASGSLVIEDLDGYFPNADDGDAWWIQGTVSSWVTKPIEPVGSYVLVELRDTDMRPYEAQP